jgi:hypothetical protein
MKLWPQKTVTVKTILHFGIDSVYYKKIFLKVKYVYCYREQCFIYTWRLKCCSWWTEELLLCLVKTLNKARIYIVKRIIISYFLALSRVARCYATTGQILIHSFWNALRIRRKINQLHQSSCYTSSIYYTTQNNPWICRYRFNGIFFWIFSASPLIHVKLKKKYSRVSYI